MNKGKLVVKHSAGNKYTIESDLISATCDLLGGGNGMMIMLHTIEMKENGHGAKIIPPAELIDHLASKIQELKRYGKFIIIYKGQVAFSLDEDLSRGMNIPTTVYPIRSPLMNWLTRFFKTRI